MCDRLIEKINEFNWLTIYTATDNDLAGNELLEILIGHFRDRVIPLNSFYNEYKDVAEYLETETR
ncbi:Uncharacterised protein [Mycobacterium tuberculosis]|nr:Uncharacterised protein [Mycobacterium tuberculosis]